MSLFFFWLDFPFDFRVSLALAYIIFLVLITMTFKIYGKSTQGPGRAVHTNLVK